MPVIKAPDIFIFIFLICDSYSLLFTYPYF